MPEKAYYMIRTEANHDVPGQARYGVSAYRLTDAVSRPGTGIVTADLAEALEYIHNNQPFEVPAREPSSLVVVSENDLRYILDTRTTHDADDLDSEQLESLKDYVTSNFDLEVSISKLVERWAENEL